VGRWNRSGWKRNSPNGGGWVYAGWWLGRQNGNPSMIDLIIAAVKTLLLTGVMVVWSAAGCNTSQTSQTVATNKTSNQTAQSKNAQSQTNQNTGTSTQPPSPIAQTNINEVPCNPSGSLNYSLYTNDKYHFTFLCPAGLKVRFNQMTEKTAVLILLLSDSKGATISLTINGPAVPLNSMQETVFNKSVTINNIEMRKRLVSDPLIGDPPYRNQEVIYDHGDGSNTFTWWAIFTKDDTVNQYRMDQIIGSFRLTE
jgi:hypothetical protein